jgi:hypothetical protein
MFPFGCYFSFDLSGFISGDKSLSMDLFFYFSDSPGDWGFVSSFTRVLMVLIGLRDGLGKGFVVKLIGGLIV